MNHEYTYIPLGGSAEYASDAVLVTHFSGRVHGYPFKGVTERFGSDDGLHP